MSVIAANNLFQVEKLTNSNFTSWKFKIENVLKSRKLWKFVDGSVVGPLDGKNQELDQDAFSQIALTVSDGVIGHIRKAKTAREAWLKICSVFEKKGLSSQIFLRRKLINVKLDETQSMQTHINKVRELADQLDAIGDPVKDKELAIIILCSLTERFDAVIISLEGRPPNEITFDSVSIRLLAEEERQNESNAAKMSTESAFYSGSNDRQKSFKKCNFCKRSGHLEEFCWDKNGRPKEKTYHAKLGTVKGDDQKDDAVELYGF